MMSTRTMMFALATTVAAVAGSMAFAQSPTPPGFVAAQPDALKWMPNPSVDGAQTAVLVGSPQQPGLLVVRIKLPAHTKVAPHTHPADRTYTVLAGEWKIGFGEKFDESKLLSFKAGALYHLPAGIAHFQSTGDSETIVQVQSNGVNRIDFINPADSTTIPPKKP
jgi:quercetin dioxygenase-like cupin family protein